MNRAQRYRQRHREKVNAAHLEYVRKRKERDPAWYKAKNRRSALRQYGITPADFARMFAEQNGCCAVCWIRFSGESAACVDHDHATGKVRALLCRPCNAALGIVEDDNLLSWLVEYRDEWKKRHAAG